VAVETNIIIIVILSTTMLC